MENVMNDIKYTAAVITVSDKGASGERDDVSGRVMEKTLCAKGFSVLQKAIVPDEFQQIKDALIAACDAGANVVLTTGGTGFFGKGYYSRGDENGY
jgi:Molybdopterin biosynthesis enzymes